MHGLLRGVAKSLRREPTTPRLKTVLEQYSRLNTVDPDTAKKNIRVFRQFIKSTGNIRIGDATRLMAASFQASLRESGKSKATIKGYCASVSSVFGWAVENIETVTENPFKGMRKQKLDRCEPTFWTRDEMDRLYRAIEWFEWRDPRQRLQWRAILAIADTCGLRIGEILNLRWDDLDLERRLIRVRYRPHEPGQCWEWGTKGHRDRAMPVCDDLLALFYRLKELCPWRYPLLKEGRCRKLQARSGQISDRVRKQPYTNLYEIWKRIRAKAGIEGDGAFHQVRRTAATEFAAHLTAPQLQTAFGWQELATAQHYIGLCDQSQMEAVAKAQTCRTAGGGS